MRALVSKNVSAAEAARLVRTGIDAPRALEDDPATATIARLRAAVVRLDSVALDREINRAMLAFHPHVFYNSIVSPILVDVGEAYARGETAIAQEHLLSERLEFALRALLRSLEHPSGPLVLLASIDSDQHVLGLLGAGLQFASFGCHLVVLGAMTPASAIAEAVRTMQPRMVGLSASMIPRSPRALFRAYAGACGEVPWVVGGFAIEHVAEAVREAGGNVALGGADCWQSKLQKWLRPPVRRPSGVSLRKR